MCILKRFLLSTPSVSIPPTPIVTTWLLSLFCKCFKKLKSLSPYDTHLQPFVTMHIRKKVFWKFSWVTLLEFINSTMHLLSTLAPWNQPQSPCRLSRGGQPGSDIAVFSCAWATWSRLLSSLWRVMYIMWQHVLSLTAADNVFREFTAWFGIEMNTYCVPIKAWKLSSRVQIWY